ncbi:hypothetical protein [Neisseria elongata]|uniref:DUF3888 domain-containing protein n=1 Tax=Neisseria elongata subsp. nitroreducens TaxID=90367 RepID=A0A9X0ZT44_NEIEL|nr:hypothetical protein [Neisseria elongata]MBS9339599.1 hypothetical protein [Neisseria elongata subsp. nitroreducens]MBS9340356.1 hypothetical protein [Neisseria elongata subsp. nitroreducens]
MKKILFLLFTIVGVSSFPAHAKSNIQKSQDCTPEKGFTIQKDLSYPLFLAMQAMKEKGLDLNNYLITYSENITKPDIIWFNFSLRGENRHYRGTPDGDYNIYVHRDTLKVEFVLMR